MLCFASKLDWKLKYIFISNKELIVVFVFISRLQSCYGSGIRRLF